MTFSWFELQSLAPVLYAIIEQCFSGFSFHKMLSFEVLGD